MDFLRTDSPLVIVDIGAAAIDTYQDVVGVLERSIPCITYGFEPNDAEFVKLPQTNSKKHFNVALGDGGPKVFHRFVAPGLNSCLTPNAEYLQLFWGFEEWTKLVDSTPIMTHRLDDIAEIKGVDFCKIDAQGMEGQIISNGLNQLKTAVCIQAELSPTPLYEGEDSFASVCALLEKYGFQLHMFKEIHTRALSPFRFQQDDPRIGLRHLFQMDCVFIPSFKTLKGASTERLIKLASILHFAYESYDLAHHCLSEVDLRQGTDFSSMYRQRLNLKKTPRRY